jgi:hypothetical protein
MYGGSRSLRRENHRQISVSLQFFVVGKWGSKQRNAETEILFFVPAFARHDAKRPQLENKQLATTSETIDNLVSTSPTYVARLAVHR